MQMFFLFVACCEKLRFGSQYLQLQISNLFSTLDLSLPGMLVNEFLFKLQSFGGGLFPLPAFFYPMPRSKCGTQNHLPQSKLQEFLEKKHHQKIL